MDDEWLLRHATHILRALLFAVRVCETVHFDNNPLVMFVCVGLLRFVAQLEPARHDLAQAMQELFDRV